MRSVSKEMRTARRTRANNNEDEQAKHNGANGELILLLLLLEWRSDDSFAENGFVRARQ